MHDTVNMKAAFTIVFSDFAGKENPQFKQGCLNIFKKNCIRIFSSMAGISLLRGPQ